MASNYNNRAKNAGSVGDGDPADLKLVIGVGVFIVLCFLVGYFVIGKKFGSAANDATPAQSGNLVAPTMVPNGTPPASTGKLTVIDNTAAIEAKRKKAEEEAKKKADEEAKKKAEEDAKKLAAQEALENTASPTPTASTSAPDPDDLPDAKANVPTTTPDAGDNAVPVPDPTPVPKPFPSPSPVSTTPDDPEDRAMATPAPPTASLGPLYRVRVGTFDDKSNAEARASELKSAGYETSLSTDLVDGKAIYRLQVAAYKSEKSAREFAKEVEAKGFKTTIAHN